MRIISGPSLDVGIRMSGLPYYSIVAGDPNSGASWLLYALLPHVRVTVPTTLARYKSSVLPESLRDAYVTEYTEPLQYREYNLADDVRKYSHSIAAALTYINGHSPTVTSGDNSVMHVQSSAVVMDDSVPLYGYDPRTLCGAPVLAMREVIPIWYPFHAYFYDIFEGQHVRTTPVIAGFGPLGAVDLYDYFLSLQEAVKTAPDFLYLVTEQHLAPRISIFLDWGPFYQHGVHKVAVSGASDHFHVTWTEWYVNGYGQYRQLDVSASFRVDDRLGANDFGSSPHAFDVLAEFATTATWYQRYAEPQPVMGHLKITDGPHGGRTWFRVEGLNYPLSRPSSGVPRLDVFNRVAPLFADTRKALEKGRTGIGYAVERLDKQLGDKFSNWIEFCAELDEVFALLPAEASEAGWSHFLTYLPSGRWHYLKTFLEVLASGYLATIFGLTPLLELAREVGPRAADLRSKLGTLLAARVRSGKVRIRPDPSFFSEMDMDYQNVYVVSACDISPNLALSRPHVVLDRIGVFPRPSRAWDLLQFSWLIGMFVNVQQRLKAVEMIVVLYWWGANNFTHSVTLESTPQSMTEFLKSRGLRTSGGRGFMKGYMRETSNLVPMLSLRTDFWAADSGSNPNWLVILSFLLLLCL